LLVSLAALMLYVLLQSNATGLSYALDKAQARRDALLEQTARLDDKIAQASSEERLAAIASKLHMRDAQTFAVVRIEAPKLVAKTKFPALDAIIAWF